MGSSESPRDRRRRVALAGHQNAAGEARPHLSDPEWRVRVSALRALHRQGSLTADELAEAMDDVRPEVRVVAVELAAGATEPPLSPGLADPDPSVVEVACWAAGERRPVAKGVMAQLIGIAREHADPLCRESAIAAIGAIGERDGLGAVLAGLDDKPAVRRRAVVALAAFEGPEVEAALSRARGDHDRQVREVAEELLGPE